MSSKTRRRKAQLARLLKLDATYHRLYLMASKRRDPKRSMPFWFNAVVALGDALERKKPGAWHTLPRSPGGPDILMHNYRKRKGIPQ